MTTSREIGIRGETLAAEYLERRGLTVLCRNWRCPEGEVDIVARDGRETVLVEVKTRSSEAAGHPFEAVTPAKVARLRRLAGAWQRDEASRQQTRQSMRIDVVAVLLPADAPAVVEHLRGVGE